jgi:hypothetical protein
MRTLIRVSLEDSLNGDKKLLELYLNNATFHTILDLLQTGISMESLTQAIAMLCEDKQKLVNQVIKLKNEREDIYAVREMLKG